MKTQKINNQSYCPAAAVRYARVLYELNIPKEDIQKAKEISEEVPQLHDIFVNPTIELDQKLHIIDQVFPDKMRNFLKVACRYQRMDLLMDIFTAYDRYCDEQNQVLSAVLTCVEPPSEGQIGEMKAFLCRKYDAKQARIEVCEDKGLMGGFVLYAQGDEYDWSLKGRLTRLEQKLTWR